LRCCNRKIYNYQFFVSGGIKKIIEAASEHAINRKQFGRPLKDFGLIQDKFARMAINAYAMESMTYMTAGMIDSDEYEDCAVEAAIVKVSASASCNECLLNPNAG